MFIRSLVLLLLLSAPVSGQQGFTVLPQAISLAGPGARARVLVQVTLPAGDPHVVALAEQLTDGVSFELANPAVARIEDQQVVGLAAGTTELLVRVDGHRRVGRIPVIVRAEDQAHSAEFTAHVQSILSRQGCNSGACHGALAGKGGFVLSLLGYDAAADHFAITSQDRGRRIEPAQPLQSLLLTKPTMEVPHKGGLRLDPESRDYQILARWIAAGSPGPRPKDARLLGIEVLPSSVRQRTGDEQELIVRAHYADGRTEDVTHWARFSSANEAVAEVDAAGRVRMVGQGRGAIVAWFASRIAIASIDVPFARPEPAPTEPVTDAAAAALAGFVPRNFIDQILADEWLALGLAPSPPCDDATFLRRAHLDATGALPTAEEVLSFLKDDDPHKRARLVDRLLSSQEFVDYWAYRWSDLLLVNGNLLRPKAVEAFYRWIREQVQQNTPWDQFARAIVLARGDSLEQGATNFYAIHQSPEAMTENTCLAFMGLSIECAKCHNHPLERWTNDQYYAMTNLFARVRAKGWGGDARNGDGSRTLVVLDRGEVIQPSRGRPQPPAPLDQPPIDSESSGDRREVLADWLTSAKNPYFSRSIVNRVWANYMGVGLVESVDDLRVSNPASSPRLMTALADYLAQSDYDLKALMRLIMNSEVYQLSSEATEHNRDDQRFYSRYYPRRLMAEVLHDAVVAVTGVSTSFDQIEFAGADKQPTDFYPLGTSALALYDSAVSNYFLQTFGRNQRRITCECERSSEPTVVQALHLSNGQTINDKLSHADCVVTHWLEQSVSLEECVRQAFLRALSRLPAEAEADRVGQQWQEAEAAGTAKREFLEDLLWSLMSSSEFLFAH